MLVKCADCDAMFDPRPSGRGPDRQRCEIHRKTRKKQMVRARAALKRAEQWGAKSETVIASVVFERDRWVCHICGKRVPRRLRSSLSLAGNYEPLAAVVDHAVPLSKGGSHTLENCRTAHWQCNARKLANLPSEPRSDSLGLTADAGSISPNDFYYNTQRQGRGRRRENFGACHLAGCDRPQRVRQLCSAHYSRLLTYGHPLKMLCGCGCREEVNVDARWFGLYYIDGHGIQSNSTLLAERLAKKLSKQAVSQRGRKYGLTDDCLVWTGPRSPSGYGRVFVRSGKRAGRNAQAHRIAYELAHGEGSAINLTIDHLCGVPLCCNVNHLEAVTAAENLKRAAQVIEACPQGHAYDDTNTLLNDQGHRICRQCNRNRYHRRKLGHDFEPDPDNPSAKRQRCLTCRLAADGKPAYCPAGHEYGADNDFRDNKGKRVCLWCRLNRTHLPTFGHEFVPDPDNPSSKRRRCIICRDATPAVTHCAHGHEFTAATTEYTRKGHRRCVLCRLNARHLPAYGHEFVIDPLNSSKLRRCLTCRLNCREP